MPPDSSALPESEVAVFLRDVGTGRLDDVRRRLAQFPGIVNASGPHPFWGGRPQPLHVAIETKRRDIFDLLLQHGAEIDGRNSDYDGWSPLMVAVDRKQQDMVDELRRRGAHIGLVEALLLGDDERTETLLRTRTALEPLPNGGSILAFARTPFALDRLLVLGARSDVVDRWGSTPIDAISRQGASAAALIRHLVQQGVSVTPEAFTHVGDLDTLMRLVEQDPHVAQRAAVMIGAVDFGHQRIVTWLLTRGANINARADAPSRHTALHSAAWNGDVDMVRLLVEAGADLYAHDEQYHATPAGWAESSIEVSNNPKCADVVAFLTSKMAD